MSDLTIKKQKSLSAIVFELMELDVDAPENKDVIEKIYGELSDKADAYVGFSREIEARREVIAAEIIFLTQQIKTLDAMNERLHDRALFALETLGTDKLTSESGHSIAIRKSHSVTVHNVDILPDEYKRVKTVVEPDKVRLGKDMKTGLVVVGAELVENKRSVFK
jgi:Siphovirus Gp157